MLADFVEDVLFLADWRYVWTKILRIL